MNADQLLLTLIVSPKLEEPMVDFLLGLDYAHGFNSFCINGHSSRHTGLSITEQVAGRKLQARFDVVIAAGELAELLRQLRTEFGQGEIHYWVIPVVENGRL